MGDVVAIKKPRKPYKRYFIHDDKQIAACKKKFLEHLEQGRSPGMAAKAVNISRSLAYMWKREDLAFDASWKDAVEDGLDMLETKVFDRAMTEEGFEEARFLLRYRRYDRQDYRAPNQQNNFIVSVSLAEHTKRLERLGLAVPVIASDLEDEDVTIIEADNDGSDTSG